MDQPVFRPAYAGIGSRETPAEVQKLMHDLAVKLAARGMILRSGGATGADQAFLSGAIPTHSHKYHAVETYLPWANFEREELRRITFGSRSHVARTEPAPWTFPIAQQHHPRWAALSLAAQKLHARNVHQILGHQPLENGGFDVVKFVVCWTSDGEATGGTGQALRIAKAHGVEIRNLHDPEVREKAKAFVAGR